MESQLSMIVQFLGVVSGSAEIVNCVGVGVEIIKSLDKFPNSNVGVHYLFDIPKWISEKLLRKPNYSATVRIRIFALLKVPSAAPAEESCFEIDAEYSLFALSRSKIRQL